MINLKPAVLQALESNQALVSLLGGKRIYQLVAPNANEFPRITFFEMTNFDDQYADDSAVSSEIHMQIDVWSKGSTSAIAQEVDKTMKSIGFQRSSAIDLYENDTQVYHKAMRYKTQIMIEEAE
jgi:hypothetical protein